MIAQLRGRVAARADDHVVIDVQGVGYLVHASARTLHRLTDAGESVELLIETQVREDSITLFGFIEPAERAWFRLLQSVQGVGARVALSLLSVLDPHDLANAIAAQDRTALSRAAGVGSRLAARIASELQSRVGELPRGSGRGAEAPIIAFEAGDPAQDALAALVKLGFGRSEALLAIQRVRARLGEATAVGDLVRESLKELTA